MFCAAFELLLLGGPNCTQVKIELPYCGEEGLMVSEREQVVWAAGDAAVPGVVQVQEHAALPVLLIGVAVDPDSLYPLLMLASVFLLSAKPGDTYEDQTI